MKSENEIKHELSEKFRNYEASPQDTSWEKIRASISVSSSENDIDSTLRKELNQKFENFEADSSKDLWSKIQENIPSDDIWKVELTSKLSNYEAYPNTESWHKIESQIPSELDEKGILGGIFDKYEADPMPDSWEKISENIKTEDIWKLDLSEKFATFEATPKESAWANIQNGIQNDALLKTSLASKFENYEAQPTEESWEIIEAAIRKEKKRRGIIIPLFYRVGIAASIALLIGSFWYLSNDNTTNGLASNETLKSQENKSSNSNHSENTNNIDNSKNISKIDNSENTSKIKISENTINSDKMINSEFSKNIENKKTDFAKNADFSLAKNKNHIKNGKKSTISHENDGQTDHKSFEESIAINKNSDQNLTNPTPTTADEPTKNLTESLSESEIKDFRDMAFNKEFQPIEFEIELPTTETKPQKESNLIFTANLMPVQAYQVYTILPQSGTYIQQIGSLNALDNERLGVQAKFGVMKPLTKRNLIGATISYTGIQQYASYQLNNGTYDIQFTDNQNYTVSSVTETVSDLQFIQTLGLKVENSYLLTQRKNRIYLTGGGEAMKVLNKNQYGFYLNAGVAVEYKIKNKSLWLEPTFRYGLSQSADNLNYVRIRPYQFGLNIRFNFPAS